MWPFSAWVPARQQVVGSHALRDYLFLFLYFLFYWSGVVFYKAGIRFLKVLSSCLWLLHFRMVMCHFVALAFLHVNLFGIGPHRLKDSFSSLVNHCFTSHYSSSWDVQIDRILHTLITFADWLYYKSMSYLVYWLRRSYSSAVRKLLVKSPCPLLSECFIECELCVLLLIKSF